MRHMLLALLILLLTAPLVQAEVFDTFDGAYIGVGIGGSAIKGQRIVRENDAQLIDNVIDSSTSTLTNCPEGAGDNPACSQRYNGDIDEFGNSSATFRGSIGAGFGTRGSLYLGVELGAVADSGQSPYSSKNLKSSQTVLGENFYSDINFARKKTTYGKSLILGRFLNANTLLFGRLGRTKTNILANFSYYNASQQGDYYTGPGSDDTKGNSDDEHETYNYINVGRDATLTQYFPDVKGNIFGLGLRTRLTPLLSMRVEWMRVKWGDRFVEDGLSDGQWMCNTQPDVSGDDEAICTRDASGTDIEGLDDTSPITALADLLQSSENRFFVEIIYELSKGQNRNSMPKPKYSWNYGWYSAVEGMIMGGAHAEKVTYTPESSDSNQDTLYSQREISLDGMGTGLIIGYDRQLLPGLYAGIELGIRKPDVKGELNSRDNYFFELEEETSLTLQLGWQMRADTIIFGEFGASLLNANFKHTDKGGNPFYDPSITELEEENLGLILGVGIKTMLSKKWFASFKLNFINYDSSSLFNRTVDIERGENTITQTHKYSIEDLENKRAQFSIGLHF